ncbi:MAG: deoxyribose-phosphate aldolase [Candidatus Saccharibacteria bacterium]
MTIEIAKYLDSTLLRADATAGEVIKLCQDAKNLGVAAVCINPWRLDLARERLVGSEVALCTVIGFPLGACDVERKLDEIDWAMDRGATEIDMVMNIGAFKDQEYITVAEEIRLAARRVQERGGLLKVIVETALLNPEELRRACIVVRDGGADYIKTSTGFSTRGVSLDDIHIIRKSVGDALKIKASGGVKTHDFALKLIKAGADRLGTSSAREVMKEFEDNEEA